MTFPAPPRLHILHVPGADPERDQIVRDLVEQGNACVHEDPSREGCMATWLRCLDCAVRTDGQYDWTAIVSDDAAPLRGWQQHLERACTYSPSPLLGITHHGSYGRTLLEAGVAYGTGPHTLWGGAIAYHQSQLAPLQRFAHPIVERYGYPHDDCLVMVFAARQGKPTAMTSRAILGQPHLRSLLNHNTAIRSPEVTIENALGPTYWQSPRSAPVRRGMPSILWPGAAIKPIPITTGART